MSRNEGMCVYESASPDPTKQVSVKDTIQNVPRQRRVEIARCSVSKRKKEKDGGGDPS